MTHWWYLKYEDIPNLWASLYLQQWGPSNDNQKQKLKHITFLCPSAKFSPGRPSHPLQTPYHQTLHSGSRIWSQYRKCIYIPPNLLTFLLLCLADIMRILRRASPRVLTRTMLSGIHTLTAVIPLLPGPEHSQTRTVSCSGVSHQFQSDRESVRAK